MIQASEIVTEITELLDSTGPCHDPLDGKDKLIISVLCRRFNAELNILVPTSAQLHYRPKLKEAEDYAAKIGLPRAEGERFFNYYESNGWKVGKNPMRNWRSAMANWKRTFDERNPKLQGLGYAV